MAAQLDESKLQAFIGKALEDMAAAASAFLVFTGDKLGLYKAMAKAGRSPRLNWPSEPKPIRAMSANGFATRRPAAM